MSNWIKKAWDNKFIRDRFFALTFVVVMVTGFWHAYHAHSDYQKLVGLIPGIISLLAILGLVTQDFNPGEDDKDDDSSDK